MRRMVVSTARGEVVTEKDVAEQQLAQELVDCYRLLLTTIRRIDLTPPLQTQPSRRSAGLQAEFFVCVVVDRELG